MFKIRHIFMVQLAFWLLAGMCVSAQQSSTKTLVVLTKESPPFAMCGEDGVWRGLSIDLWEYIAQKEQISFQYRATDLDGLIGQLENDEAHLAVAALTITADREARIDFAHPFYTSGFGIAVPVQRGAPAWLTVVAGLFSLDFLQVVGALLGLLLVVGALVWLFEKRRNAEQFGGHPVAGLGAGVWWSAVTMTTVGYGDKAPQTILGRLVALVWMFASVIIISSFTAAIASSLTVGRLAGSIQGPDDLPGKSLATVAGSTSEAYLEQHGLRGSPYPTAAEALKAVAKGTSDAMVYDEPILQYLANTELAGRVSVIPGTFDRQDYGFAVPTDSPLREQLNRAVLEAITTDTWRQIKTRYLGQEG